MSSHTLIITGGDLTIEFLADFIAKHKVKQVIVVDGGLTLVKKFEEYYQQQLLLTYIVGDFDTVSTTTLDSYSGRDGVEIRRFNPQKDNTDTEIALNLAIEVNQGEQISILGGLGTRMDHTLANIQMMLLGFKQKIEVCMYDKNNKLQIIEKKHSLQKQNQYGKYISLVPIDDAIEEISLEGFKYPLRNRSIIKGSSLCISNEIINEEAYITIKRGRMLLIESND